MKFVYPLVGIILLFVSAVCPSNAQSISSKSVLTTNASGSPSAGPDIALRSDLISPSPNAVSLGKFGIIPVSLYTGIPDISISLGDATGKEISIPISINYHHNGLKSYELSSWVGLGWTLNAGGVISRIVKDKLDESVSTDFKYENNISKYTFENVSQDFLYGAMYSGTYDTEPDLYAFNFGKYSGKFMVYKGVIYQFPYQKLKITGSPIVGFSIITPEGTIYDFQDTETTHSKGSQYSSYTMPDYTSSWYLSTVKPADQKETITFSYVTSADPIVMHSPTSQTYQQLLSGYGSIGSTLSGLSTPLPSNVYTKRLSSISTSKMTINFLAQSTGRTDIQGEYALDQIVYSSSNGNMKTYKFNNSYFGTGSATTLKLLSLDEQDSQGNLNTVKTHTFQYNEPGNIWPVQTNAVDHWGYANGASYTTNIMPNTIVNSGMDREPHLSAISLGMLRKIIYPTGGSSVFTFEPNICETQHQTQTIPQSISDFIDRSDPSDNTLVTTAKTFTLTTAQTVGISYSRTPKQAVGDGPPNGPDDPTKDLVAEITITGPAISSTGPLSYKILTNRDNGGVSTTASLPAGTYTVTLSCDSKEQFTSFNIGYINQTNNAIEGMVGPGLRVKEIDNFSSSDESSTPTLKKRYTYTDANGFSTGRLMKGVDYGSKQFVVEDINNATSTYMIYSSFINSALGDLIDQDFYYRLVNEYTTSSSTDLRTQSEFNSTAAINSYDGSVVVPTLKTDYKKVGTVYQPVLKHEYFYNFASEGQTYFSALKPYQTILRTTSYSLPLREYGWDWYSLLPGSLRYLASEKETTYTGLNSADEIVTSTVYVNDISSKLNLRAVKTIDSRGQEKITKFKYPEDYDPALTQTFLDHHVLSPVIEQQTWLKRSAADSVLLFGKVDDYDLSLFKPKSSYLLEVNKPLAGPNQESVNGSGLYSTILSDSHYKIRILNTYDSSTGNMVSQDLLNSSTSKQVSYIWGYHNSSTTNLYPIAQCNNGALTDFFYTGFEDGGASVLSGYSHTGVNYYNGNYALNFAISNTALSYSYSYWYKSNGVWQYSGELSYGGPLTLTGEAFDDIRVYPVSGQMSTYTYLPEIGISSSTDAKGQTSYYEYDSFQRLKTIRDQNSNIIKTYDYHYKTN